MPTYEYECEKCGHAFERLQPISARPLKKCPNCGKMGLRRLIGAGIGVIFKGSGFYETDYRRKRTASEEKKSTDSKDAAASKGDKPKAKATDAGTGRASSDGKASGD